MAPPLSLLLMLLAVLLIVANGIECAILLNGTGSSGPGAVYSQFGFVYPVSEAPRVHLDLPYSPRDSQTGVNMVLTGDNAWGGTDLPLTANQSQLGLRIFPTMIGGTVIVYNLPPLYASKYALNLTQEAIVGILNGTVRAWSDPIILNVNPALVAVTNGTTILDRRPVIVVRDDYGSGQTYTVTSALSSFSPAWNASYGAFSGVDGWPLVDVTQSFDRIPFEVLVTDFSISYTDIHTAWVFQLPIAAIQNKAGFFVVPTNLTLGSAAADFAQQANAADINDAYVSMVDGPSNFSYPITSATYAIVRNGNPADCNYAYELVRYMWWIIAVPATGISESARIARIFGFIGVAEFRNPPLNVYAKLSETVLNTLRCNNGLQLLDTVKRDLDSETVNTQGRILIISVAVMAGIVGVLALSLCLWWRRTEATRAKKVQSGQRELVTVPKEHREVTQRELNATINRAVLEKKKTKTLESTTVEATAAAAVATMGYDSSWDSSTAKDVSTPILDDVVVKTTSPAPDIGLPSATSTTVSSQPMELLDNSPQSPMSAPAAVEGSTQIYEDLPAPKPTPRPIKKQQTSAPARILTNSGTGPRVPPPVRSGTSYQTTLIRSSTGTLRAVVGPVQYSEIAVHGSGSRAAGNRTATATTISQQDIPGTMARASTLMSTQSSTATAERRVAVPITVKPRWQRSFVLHITWVIVRTGMDLVATLLNWIGFLTLPDGLLLSGVYAALCVVGSCFFVFNMLAAIGGLLYHKKNKVELETTAMRGRRRVSIDQMAYVKSELRRLQIICVREIVYRVSLLLREIPLILVAIVIVNQTSFSEIWLELGLCANCISLGFKLRSIPQTVDDFIAYVDMRDLYAVLKSPASFSATNSLASETGLPVGEQKAPSGDIVGSEDEGDEPGGFSYHSLQRPGVTALNQTSTMEEILMGLGGMEPADPTMDRQYRPQASDEGRDGHEMSEMDASSDPSGAPNLVVTPTTDSPPDSEYPTMGPGAEKENSEFGTLTNNDIARVPSSDQTVATSTLGRNQAENEADRTSS